MARLLVVSRSMALALRLADTHHVVEAPLESLAELSPSPDVDAVVLDVGDPALAVRTIDRLRRAGDTTPLLVVSGYQPAWAGLATVDLPSVVVVPLPVTRGALLEGIDRLTQARPGGGPAAGPAGGAAEPLVRPYRAPAPGGAAGPAAAATRGPAPGADDGPEAGSAVTRPIPVPGRAAPPVTGRDGDAEPATDVRAGRPGTGADPGLGPAGGSWHGGGFDWWTGTSRPAADDATGDPLDQELDQQHDDPLRPLRRGWPPADVPPPPRSPRSTGTAGHPQAPREPAPGVGSPGVGAPGLSSREALSGSLLGRPAHGAADMSVFRRRLGGRRYATGLGPGGTSPELVALGAAGTGGGDGGEVGGEVEVRRSEDGTPGEPVPDLSVERLDRALLPPEDRRLAAADLVGALLDRVPDVVGVLDAALATAERSAEAAGAEAAAVLVPDGGLWRVAGAVGLPEPERHLVLDGAHWLVGLLAGGAGEPVVVRGPDAVPHRSGELPLAGWAHVLAAPVPGTGAAVLVARDQAGPFTPDDAESLRSTAGEAAGLLEDALRVRHLARLLAPLRS